MWQLVSKDGLQLIYLSLYTQSKLLSSRGEKKKKEVKFISPLLDLITDLANKMWQKWHFGILPSHHEIQLPWEGEQDSHLERPYRKRNAQPAPHCSNHPAEAADTWVKQTSWASSPSRYCIEQKNLPVEPARVVRNHKPLSPKTLKSKMLCLCSNRTKYKEKNSFPFCLHSVKNMDICLDVQPPSCLKKEEKPQ